MDMNEHQLPIIRLRVVEERDLFPQVRDWLAARLIEMPCGGERGSGYEIRGTGYVKNRILCWVRAMQSPGQNAGSRLP